MSKDNKKYPIELLQRKTKEELIQLIGDLQEEVAMLDFLIAEYEGMQEAMGKALKEGLVEHYNETVLSNIETGEA